MDDWNVMAGLPEPPPVLTEPAPVTRQTRPAPRRQPVYVPKSYPREAAASWISTR